MEMSDIDFGALKWESLIGDEIMICRSELHAIGENENHEKQMANMGTIVCYSYNCYVINENNNTLIESVNNEMIKIGDADVIPALELSLRHSYNKSSMIVKCSSKYAYGPSGRLGSNKYKEIHPDSNLVFDITSILHVQSCDDVIGKYEIDSSCKNMDILDLFIKKDSGNRWFAWQDYSKAAYCYSKGIRSAEVFLNADHSNDEIADLTNVLIVLLNNLSACYLSMKEYVKAKETCIKVLEINENNFKAILRASRASLALDEYDECEACLKKLQSLYALQSSDTPNDIDIYVVEKELVKLSKARKFYQQKSKELDIKMSKQLFSADNKKNNRNESKEVSTDSLNIKSENLNSGDKIENNDASEENKIESIAKYATSSPASNSFLFLLTSFVVVIISLIVAYYVGMQ